VIPRPGTHRPPPRHLRWRTRGRSPPRTAVGAGVVPPVDGPANASPDDRHDQLLDASLLPSQPLTAKVLRRPVESALAAPVRVMHQPLQPGPPAPDRHLQRVQRQVGPKRPGSLPADQEAAEGVDDERHVDEAGPGRHVGEVGDPQLVGPGGREVAIHQVGRARRGRVGCGGAAGLATADTLQVKLAHQPLDRAAGHRDSLAVQLPPDLAGTVDAELLGVDPSDLALELGVAHSARRGGSAAGGVIGGRGDR
jgi:hypothetical protein